METIFETCGNQSNESYKTESSVFILELLLEIEIAQWEGDVFIETRNMESHHHPP